MTVNTHPTGAAGTMRIDDDGSQYLQLYLLGVNERVEQIPWTYIHEGKEEPWRSFTLEANQEWQQVSTIAIDNASQVITFRLGDSHNVLVGGPTDFELEVTRVPLISGGTGYARILVDGIYRQAIPFVNDNGEWKQTEPWAKLRGEWRPAPS